MNLTRPLVFFDLETTGVITSHDRIVQFAAIKIMPDDTRITKQYLINPTIPIPAGASEVHGITDDMVADQATFSEMSNELYEWMSECDLAGYNSNNFDIPLLCEEFGRCEMVWPANHTNLVDVYQIERMVNSHKLTETYKRYTGLELQGAHDAMADTQATLDVWTHQIQSLTELDSIQAIDIWTQGDRKRYDIAGKMYINNDDIVCRSFGKHRDKPVHDDLSYCQRVMNSEFPIETKVKLQEWVDGRGG